MGATKALPDKWAHAREQTFDLRSGAGTATVKALDLPEALSLGRIPNPLRPVAMKAASGNLNTGEFSEEEWKDWLSLICEVVAQATKKFDGKDVELTPEFVRDSMPPEDRVDIFARATHVLTADQLMGVMAFAGFRRGDGSPEPAEGGEGDGEGSE